jgi:undecaprenyl-diphosphatase
VEIWQIFILAVVQGLTEFLPISSSAHLILVPVLTEWPDQGLTFDVAVHIGSLMAVVVYFRQQIGRMIVDWFGSLVTGRQSSDSHLAWAIIWTTVPVGLFGLLLKGYIETDWRSPVVIACSLIGFGLVLAYADWGHKSQRDEHSLGWKDVLIIGLAQALALIPGTSRSGITMTAALMVGLSREAASRFSFLLAIPVIVLAMGLESFELIQSPEPVAWGALFWGVLLSAISAFVCIHYFLAFIKRIGMQPFVIYRVALGIMLLWIFWL